MDDLRRQLNALEVRLRAIEVSHTMLTNNVIAEFEDMAERSAMIETSLHSVTSSSTFPSSSSRKGSRVDE
jgi:hypothetical protein